ncbi:MAG: LCP family protein [Anaerolineales bacterium]|nr:LCP family protein [Anaerolineales bacterium]
MTRFQKAALAFLLTVAFALTAAIVWIYSTKWQTPLGPPLQLTPQTPFKLAPTWTPDALATSTARPLFSVSEKSTQLSSSPTADASCGAQGTMFLLLIGSDSRGDSYQYGLADMIRIARVDFANAEVTVLEFPRDMWVEIPDIADNLNGQDHEKLNQAYLYGNPGFKYTTDPAQGPGLLARTLALNFGTKIDHYAAVNMRTFVNVVNAVGGIDVYLPEPVDGRTADDLSSRLIFPAGELHLMGDRALTLARIRIEGGFVRTENQNRVLCALRDQLVSPAVVDNIPALIQSFKDNVQTDLTPEQIGQLACIGTKVEAGDIRFAEFPENLFNVTRQYDAVFGKEVSIVKTDFKILRDYVTQFNEGSWPPPSGAPENNSDEVPFCP